MNLYIFFCLTMMISVQSYAKEQKWYSFDVDNRRNEVTECASVLEHMTPAKLMKHYDELEISYEKRNELRDKSEKVISLALVKTGGSSGEFYHSYFRDLKECKSQQAKAKTEIDKKLEPKRAAEKAKYGDYE